MVWIYAQLTVNKSLELWMREGCPFVYTGKKSMDCIDCHTIASCFILSPQRKHKLKAFYHTTQKILNICIIIVCISHRYQRKFCYEIIKMNI